MQEQQEEHENKINELRETNRKCEWTIFEHETNIRNLRSEIESLQHVNNSENSELKERFNKELEKLTAQFTTEMEQLQQR